MIELGMVHHAPAPENVLSITDRWCAVPGGNGVLVYDISQQGWPLVGDLTTGRFDVKLNGDLLITSDPWADDLRGRCWLFRWTGSNWVESKELSASDGASSDLFGFGLCIDEGTVVSCAPNRDEQGVPDAGAAYVYYCTPPIPELDRVVPDRGNYRGGETITLEGRNFSAGNDLTVYLRRKPASNVVLVDDSTIKCDVPDGLPGPALVTVVNDVGADILERGYTYTPAILLESDLRPGGSLQARYLCDPGDGMFAILGLPPETGIDTPPFGGQLCIFPYWKLFVVRSWPFDELDFDTDIPDDPNLSGLDVLFQALVGPSFARPKDASWTNCAHLFIE